MLNTPQKKEKRTTTTTGSCMRERGSRVMEREREIVTFVRKIGSEVMTIFVFILIKDRVRIFIWETEM
jgi:hypothetical protein